jgi:hypothetical protein
MMLAALISRLNRRQESTRLFDKKDTGFTEVSPPGFLLTSLDNGC